MMRHEISELRLEMATQRNEHATKVSRLMAERRSAAQQTSCLSDENCELKRQVDHLQQQMRELQQGGGTASQPEGDGTLWEPRAMEALEESAQIAFQLERTLTLLHQSLDQLFYHRCGAIILWSREAQAEGFRRWCGAVCAATRDRVRAQAKETPTKLRKPTAGKNIHRLEEQGSLGVSRSSNPLFNAARTPGACPSPALASSPWSGCSKWRSELSCMENRLQQQELEVSASECSECCS